MATHMDGQHLCRFITSILLRTLQLDGSNVVGISRDSCATNGVACRNLASVMCPRAMQILCVSHTLQHTGEHFDLETLRSLVWQELTGVAMKGYSHIRWWSRWEIMKQLATKFHHLEAFISRLEQRSIGDSTTRALRRVLDTKKEQLQLELAAALDMELLCSTTYKLEGDGLEILLAFDAVEEIRSKYHTIGLEPNTMPNLAAILRASEPIVVGLKTYEWFDAPYNAWYAGTPSIAFNRVPTTSNMQMAAR
eukprot:scaffold236692_cov41-Tisochrysis_lutea.AAC.2